MVDIIIPTFRARETLPLALDSLVAQTKKLFIVTIVQDADGEDYTDIIEKYRVRGLKIRLLQMKKNGGPGAARQYGMDTDLKSEFFMFMDSDDLLNPRAVEILSREIKINNADVVTSNFLVIDKDGTSQLMDVDNTPCTWCHGKIYRAQYLRANKIRFLPNLRLNEDSYFNLVAVNSTKNKFKVHEVTYIWHRNDNSLTRAEGGDGFFIKSWENYVRSQVYGLMDLGHNVKVLEPGLVAATLINVYTHHMKALSNLFFSKCKKEDFLLAENELKLLGKNKCVIDAINNEEFWNYLCRHLMACEKVGHNVIFYKMRFVDWLKEYITEAK
jgi:glycosyltransferase involved in cell wall biosynthesis